MPTPQPTLNLTISLSKEQLGFLAYLYPNEDPEDALINLLDRARNRAIRRAEQQVRVLHPGQGEAEDQEEDQKEVVSPVDASRRNMTPTPYSNHSNSAISLLSLEK